MVNPVVLLANLLREKGVAVSTPEVMDSLSALALVPVYDAAAVKTALKATLIKDRDLSRVFDEAFDEVFPAYPAAEPPDEGGAGFLIPGSFPGARVIEGSGSGGGVGRGAAHTGSGREGASTNRDRPVIRGENGREKYRRGERNLADLSFAAAGGRQKQEMLSLIRALSRKMAARKGPKHKPGGGRLNYRKIWRGSTGSGGVPLDLAWQQRRRNKPRLFIICDLSKSMAPFLPFILEFVFCFASVRGTVRVFAFVDSIGEITGHIDPVDIKRSVERVSSGARIVRRGLTDYGNAIRGFYREYRHELNSRTTIIVVGDARNNDFAAEAPLLGEIGQMCSGIYWLNPEGSAYWGMGDSYMNVYAPYCRSVFECSNVSQLRSFMEQLDNPG